MNQDEITLNAPQPGWVPISLKYGLILGVFSTILSLITLITNSTGNFFIGVAGFIIMIFIIVKSNREFKQLNGGYMTYGQGFKITFLTVLISGIISSLITFIYLSFIDPSALEGMKQAKMEMMEKMANLFGAQLPDEEMEK